MAANHVLHGKGAHVPAHPFPACRVRATGGCLRLKPGPTHTAAACSAVKRPCRRCVLPDLFWRFGNVPLPAVPRRRRPATRAGLGHGQPRVGAALRRPGGLVVPPPVSGTSRAYHACVERGSNHVSQRQKRKRS